MRVHRYASVPRIGTEACLCRIVLENQRHTSVPRHFNPWFRTIRRIRAMSKLHIINNLRK